MKKEGSGLKEQNEGISKEIKRRYTGWNGKEIKRQGGSRENQREQKESKKVPV
jgi:hypothetical protein